MSWDILAWALAVLALVAFVAIVLPRTTLSSAKEVKRVAGRRPLYGPTYPLTGSTEAEAKVSIIREFILPESIAKHFPQGENFGVVGGQARVAAYCFINGVQWPQSYCPRDDDHLYFDPKIPFGEIKGERITGLDNLVSQSFQSYCAQLDLTSNGVMVKQGVLYLDELAYEAFSSGVVNLRTGNHALERGISGLEYLCLRAAVQTGWDVRVGAYHPRAGALALSADVLAGLVGLPETHWYWETYLSKIEQVKSGNH